MAVAHRMYARALFQAAQEADRVDAVAADLAALAVHLMINTAITGAAYDIDGGQQLLSG